MGMFFSKGSCAILTLSHTVWRIRVSLPHVLNSISVSSHHILNVFVGCACVCSIACLWKLKSLWESVISMCHMDPGDQTQVCRTWQWVSFLAEKSCRLWFWSLRQGSPGWSHLSASCLYLPSSGTTDMYHHTQFSVFHDLCLLVIFLVAHWSCPLYHPFLKHPLHLFKVCIW